MTVKELKEFIKDLPDDSPVFAMDREMGEYEVEAQTRWFRRVPAKRYSTGVIPEYWEMFSGKPKNTKNRVQGVFLQ